MRLLIQYFLEVDTVNEIPRAGAAHARSPLLFHEAMGVLVTGRWKETLPDNAPFVPAEAQTRAAQASVESLVASTFLTAIGFVRAYRFAMQDETASDPPTPTQSWPTPKAVTRTRVLHGIVSKEWQPSDESNDFAFWQSRLGPSGQACVSFATELLEVDEFEVRDYLAGLAQGMSSAASVNWLAPDFPNP